MATVLSAAAATRTRWWMLVLFSLMYLICYLDRGIISVAQPEMRQAFGLTLGQMGLVLAAFTWAYAVGQIPIGWLGDRFGPKRVLTLLIVGTSACAILTGAAVGLMSLFAARFLLGIAESGAFPVASRGMQLWFAPSERGRIQGVTHFFSRFAVAITPLTARSATTCEPPLPSTASLAARPAPAASGFHIRPASRRPSARSAPTSCRRASRRSTRRRALSPPACPR